MTRRKRIIAMVFVIVVLAAVWMFFLAPGRSTAASPSLALAGATGQEALAAA